ALLGGRCDRRRVLRVLLLSARGMAAPVGSSGGSAHGVPGFPEGHPAPTPPVGRARLQHPTLDRLAQWRPLRRARRTVTPGRRHSRLLPSVALKSAGNAPSKAVA